MAKMQARRQKGNKEEAHKQLTEQDQVAAAARRGMTLSEYCKSGGSGLMKNKERRMKKQKKRVEKANEEANRMEIG